MEPILQTKKLDLHYGAFQALYGIDTDIFPNEITALIGPSGCGKSTYLKTINRMNDFVPGCKIDGAVLFHGHNVYGDKIDVTELRSRIGMVFQKPNPFPMSIYDNIAYAPRLHGVRGRAELDEIVERSLKSAAIWDETKDKLKKSALGLSGGQQQRLCIARALAAEPEVLLMDEPLSNLDAKLRVEMRNAIKRIQQQFGITTVYVTHDQEEALAVSDRIAVMDGGVIQQIDTPQRVYQRPANRFVSNFIGLSNFLNATVSRGEDGAELCFAGSDYRAAMTNLRGEASDGMDVLAAVRPEEFLLSTGEGEGIPATVRSSVFLGTTTHYFLTLPTGQEIEAVRDSDEEWAVIPDGAEVRLRVKPRRINVFTADGKRSLVIREELL